MQNKKIQKLTMQIKCLKIKKASEDIRGEKFTKLYLSFVDFLTSFLIEQSKIYIDHVENNPQQYAKESGTKIIQKYIDYVPDMSFDSDFENKITEFMMSAHFLGQDETTIQVSGMMEVDNVLAERYAKERSAELMKMVNETTKTQVRDLFHRAFSESWTMYETVQAIIDDFWFSEYRSALIAHMETANAYEVGKAQQFGRYASIAWVTGWKRSITQHDSVVRAEHKQNEDEWWIPNSQLFSGTLTEYAPHWFNCRCVVVRSLIDPDMMP